MSTFKGRFLHTILKPRLNLDTAIKSISGGGGTPVQYQKVFLNNLKL